MKNQVLILGTLFGVTLAFQNCSDVAFSDLDSSEIKKTGVFNEDEVVDDGESRDVASKPCSDFNAAITANLLNLEVVNLNGADLVAQNADFGKKQFVNVGHVEVSNIDGPVFVQAKTVGTIQDINGPVCIVTNGSVEKVANVLGPVMIIGTAAARSVVDEVQNTGTPYFQHSRVKKIGSLNGGTDYIYAFDSAVDDNSSSAEVIQ